MYSDERRSPAHERSLRTARLLTDPEALIARIDALEAQRARDLARLAELESTVGEQSARAADEANRRQVLQKELNALTHSYRMAQGALTAYRAETARLKDDLARVRASRSLKVGRAVLKPATAVKGLLAPSGQHGEGPRSESASGEPARDAAVTDAPHEGAPSPEEAPQSADFTRRQAPERAPDSLEALLDAFRAEPDPVRLMRVVNHRWFTRGEIREPAALLREHPSLVALLGPEQRRVAEQILGYERMLQAAPQIPARASGAAYTPEPGRIMYCVHSTPTYNSNGYSARTRGVAEGLRAAGGDVSVVARLGYPWDTPTDVPAPVRERTVVTSEAVDYVHLPGPSLLNTPIDRYILATADAFVREARLQRPEIIHSASNFRTALPALIAARRLGVPFIYEVRGLWEVTEAAQKPGWEASERFSQMAALETLVACEADAVLAITSQIADELERRGAGRTTTALAPNAVDPRQYLPLPKDEGYAAEKKVRTDVPVIGFAGSIVGYEGLDTLLRASGILHGRGVDHQVVIAGSGTALADLKAQRDRESLDTVKFVGRVPVAEMPRLLSTIDIITLPRVSTAVTELVSPLKPLEAFASAKAVVLSDVAPHIDLVGPSQERGLLFPAGDADALADALQRLVEQPDLRSHLGRTARLWTIDERTWEHLGRTMLQVHEEASARHAEATTAHRGVHDLRIGLIADEFTTETLRASAHVTVLDRERWREQLEVHELDLVLVESAWAGNGGQWTRGVGYYGEEENRDLFTLLAVCRERGVPTVFWNKEDPVHFDRFRRTAAQCEHVFTTDANRILPYLETDDSLTRTVSSLPFYAQPAIHNPLPARTAFEPTAAYAGTYYGDRYRTRSQQLRRLLTEAAPYGLAIYDRQLANPDSPYRFPPELSGHVRGHLAYDQVIDSYKSHLVQLNVNSVIDSPTMFSRRVVEIAACGGVVLSGPGRGVTETFGGVIPAGDDPDLWRTLLHAWSTDPVERVREAWFQMRAVHRAHTVDAALTLLARTIGLPIEAPRLPSYSLVIDPATGGTLRSVAAQSVRPLEVFLSSEADVPHETLRAAGIRVRDLAEVHSSQAEWLGRLTGPAERTRFEDLLLATRFGDWNRIIPTAATDEDAGAPLAIPVETSRNGSGLAHAELIAESEGLDAALSHQVVRGVELLLAPPMPADRAPVPAVSSEHVAKNPAQVIVAGHDLKFATTLIDALERAGHTVDLDHWTSHTQHDEERSRRLLESADAVFCEWGLGNAVWYSKNARPHQRVVVRVHSQELRRPHLAQIAHENVDAYVFVGELIRRAAIESHGVPEEKTCVIPNPVDVDSLALPKTQDAETTLGMVGVVAQPKRLDRALDLLELLQTQDERYRLRVKGKQPAEYPWMRDRPDEMAYYDEQYARIARLNARRPRSVVFDGFGTDMPAWYQRIGIAISVSDFESFHLTIADGAASGALPVSIDWAGADQVYPREWVCATIEQMAERILTAAPEPQKQAELVRRRFGADRVLADLVDLAVPTHLGSDATPGNGPEPASHGGSR